jgi:hypothetical protein
MTPELKEKSQLLIVSRKIRAHFNIQDGIFIKFLARAESSTGLEPGEHMVSA